MGRLVPGLVGGALDARRGASFRFIIKLWDRADRGDVKRAGELRQWMDGYGLTPKGQMDRRWRRPDPPRPMTPFERIRQEAAAKRGDPRTGTRSRFRDLIGGESAKERLTRIEQEARPPASRSRFDTVIEPERSP